jgi:predicted GIY-YIG superfamily endonuclease
MTDERPHALYRFYNAAGELLYIGITGNLGQRWDQHNAGKPWWAEVASSTVEHFDSRTAVLAAEKAAIAAERPKYNVVHNNGHSVGQPSATLDLVNRGDVIAVGMRSGECHVGLVQAVTERGVRLSLMSFMDGSFGHASFVLFWPDVAQVMTAPEKHPDDMDEWERKYYRAMHGGRMPRVFDTERLGTFQTLWLGRSQRNPNALITMAADPENGSACATHLREEAS